MHLSTSQNLMVFIILSSILILLLVCFVIWIVYRYQQKQNAHFKNIEEIRVAHENVLLQSQIEMQENTFQHISKEIHDNIGQKLSLAKLLLNTLPYHSPEKLPEQVASSTEIIGQAVNELSDLSRSLSNEIVLANGIIKATEAELLQIEKSSIYKVNFNVNGETVFMQSNRELILFRVIQECLHNILKHAEAAVINVDFNYGEDNLIVHINDDGKGFNTECSNGMGTGIKNMQKRIQLINGNFTISSDINKGTQINIEIPFT